MTTWIILLALGQAPDVTPPKAETQAEALALYFLGLACIAIVVLFGWLQKVHGGHKKQIREQEAAYRDALRQQYDREQNEREKVSDRLFNILEKVTRCQEDETAAVRDLIREYQMSRGFHGPPAPQPPPPPGG